MTLPVIKRGWAIERYEHKNTDGVQWILYEIARTQVVTHAVFRTRNEAVTAMIDLMALRP